MGDQSRSLSRFRVLFEWTLRNYERQTGTELVKHPLAQRLRGCRSIESVVGVFQEQMPALGSYDDWDEDRIMKSLKGTVSVLYTLSTRTVLGKATSLVRQNT
jgi:hypothetical protein